MRKLFLASLAAALAVVSPVPQSAADVTSDRPASILVFPRVLVGSSTFVTGTSTTIETVETVIQISNTANDPVDLHCFYVDATRRCSRSDFACEEGGGRQLGCPLAQDLCLPRWTETDFQVKLTPRQPIAWLASRGLRREDLPLDGRAFVGPRGDSNVGTLVPPVRQRPIGLAIPGVEAEIYIGELKCIVVDDSGRAIASNVIKGEATVTTLEEFANEGGTNQAVPLAAKYNAIGILGIEGDANGDGVLELGGGANEYNGCSNVLIAQHFFDGAELFNSDIRTELTLVPCTQNLRSQIPGSTTAQFLVFNEFEQRFSTSVRVDCLFRKFLSEIDTRDGERSIFSAEVAGTFGGQTRIRGVDGGLLGVLTEVLPDIEQFPLFGGDDSYQLGLQGDRESPDRITVPR